MFKSPYHDDAFRLLLQKVTVPIITTGYQRVDADWKHEPYMSPINRIYWILDGEGCVEVDQKRYYPKAGSLVILPRGRLHAFSTINSNTYTLYWCHFKARLGESDLFNQFSFPIAMKMRNKARVTQLFEQMHYHFWNRRRTSPFMLQASMYELLSLYLDQALEDERPLANEQPEVIKTVIVYIEQNLSRRISVEELAQLAHYHPNYFIRYFHSMLGTSPVQYIKHLRMEKAKTLLLSTDLTVTQIAQHVGIQHSNFTPLFKTHTGYPPFTFREMARKD